VQSRSRPPGLLSRSGVRFDPNLSRTDLRNLLVLELRASNVQPLCCVSLDRPDADRVSRLAVWIACLRRTNALALLRVDCSQTTISSFMMRFAKPVSASMGAVISVELRQGNLPWCASV
jgi:hypothetical protein